MKIPCIFPDYQGIGTETGSQQTAPTANPGCKYLIDRNPDLVMAVEFATDRFIGDIDTQSEYRNTVELSPR